VRSQIDRLTPWSANEAVFGWTISTASAPERISLLICATARSVVIPYLSAFGGLGMESVVVSTFPEGEAAQALPIRVLEDRGESRLAHGRIRRGLTGLFLLAALIAAVAGIANDILGDGLDAQKAELAHAISTLRQSLHRGAGGASPAQQVLEQRKRETPSSVIVLEALSRILPDHTYVTELRIEGDKLQIIGVTHDAPELIRLIEQSPNFTRATFFAPTTSTAGEPGEHFHIEARIKPVFAVGS
jgi:general secretion pathway protein L